MSLILAAVGIMVAGAVISLILRRLPPVARFAGPATAVLGSIIGIIPAADSLISGAASRLTLPWKTALGSMNLGLDPLSAFFAIPILLISALCAVYGSEYLRPYERNRDIGRQWFFFNILTASMVVVVLARDAVSFLLAWETMSLASFFLVAFENERAEVRRAGWIYLVATHVGTAFLLVLFLVLGAHFGSLDFDKFELGGLSAGMAGALFLLAVAGFGTKAGFMPMHIWLPEAHPAAPSHVSAVMSGVMIKTGIYGLLRIITCLGTPPEWWGWLLIMIGVVSGILGVLFALAQHDLKRLLAYHSVENIGIIALGIGIGMLGVTYNSPGMILLGFGGGLLHVLNHAVFKSLLFLGAGAVLHATGTREIDHLGGLLKKMPATAFAFLIGSAAICGLPPLNGFVSEFLIYLGAFTGIAGVAAAGIAGLVAIFSLALIGGLALACFTKAFGIVFLGEGRTGHVDRAHDPGIAMRVPMAALVVLCFALGLAGPAVAGVLLPVIGSIVPSSAVWRHAGTPFDILWAITAASALILALCLLFALVRSRLLARRKVAQAVTWDCGYSAPTASMQYTSSSFAAPITKLFRLFLETRGKIRHPEGLFPNDAHFSSETPDFYRERVYKPLFAAVNSGLARFRWIQHGRLNLYILCIVLALVVLLVWKLR